MMKSITITVLLFLLTNVSFAQPRPPFSEKTVEFKDRVFLPYTKGEVVRKINGPRKPLLDQICSIITTWDSIAPPQGLKVLCNSFYNSLEIYFLPYLFEDGVRFASEGGPRLSITVNDPASMLGSPIAPGIFLCPQKRDDFFGYPICQNNQQEVTIISHIKVPLFIPVSREEYLKALIAKEKEKAPKNSASDFPTTLNEMEQAYQKLLKIDPQAAKDFKQEMDKFREEIAQNDYGINTLDLVSMLEKELSGLTAEEKKQNAYFGGWAMEEYHNASGLIPYEQREKGDALVRVNPALISNPSKDTIQLLIIIWSIGGNNLNADKPRFYNEGRNGFNLASDLMSKLYKNQTIWKTIFNLCP